MSDHKALADDNLADSAQELLDALQALLGRIQLDKECRYWFPKEQEDARKAIAKALTPQS